MSNEYKVIKEYTWIIKTVKHHTEERVLLTVAQSLGIAR